ncbi:MAG: phage tail protein [bacterium]
MSKIYPVPPATNQAPTQSAQIAALGELIPVLYGRVRLAPLVGVVSILGDRLMLLCVWGLGPVDGIESITINDLPPPAGVVIRHYQGVVSQGVDTGLASAVDGYADTLRALIGGDDIEVAYSVIEVPAGAVTGFPRVMGIVRGRPVFDPRSGQTGYSDNPALCLGDYIASTVYGQGRPVLGLAEAADACDELVGGLPRRRFGLSISERKATSAWVETLRAYAGCYALSEGESVRLAPNRPAAAVETLSDNDMVKGSFGLSRSSARDVPTVVTVTYTDTSVVPWREGRAVAYAPGVIDGSRPWREENHAMPGIQRGAQALREASERLAAGSIAGLDVVCVARDVGLKFQPGDVINISHRLYSAPVRVLKVMPSDRGRHRIEAVSYDAGMYSDETVFTELLPPPAAPRADSPDAPSISGDASGNATYEVTADGTVRNRIRVDLVASTDPNVCSYSVRFRKSGTSDIWQPGSVEGLTAWLEPVVEGETYTYEVSANSCSGSSSSWVSADHTVATKDVAPPAFSSISAETDVGTGTRIIQIVHDSPADLAGFRLEYSLSVQVRVVETTRIPTGSSVIRGRAEDLTGNASSWRYTTSTYFPPAEPDGLGDLRDDVAIVQGDVANQGTDIDGILNELPKKFEAPAIDNSGPPAATGLTFDGPVARATWTADPGARRYKVEVWGNNVKRKVVETADTYFDYSADDAKANGGPWRTIQFRVWSIGFDEVLGSGYRTINMTNNAPSAPNVSVSATSNYIMITVNSLPYGNDLSEFVVAASQTSGFNPEGTVAVRKSYPVSALKPVIAVAIVPGSTWYVKCAVSDAWGTDGLSWTGQAQQTASRITGTQINDQAISTPKLAANAVTADKILVSELSALTANIGTVNAGLLQGVGGRGYVNLNAVGAERFISLVKSSGETSFAVDGDGGLLARGDIEASAIKVDTIETSHIKSGGQITTQVSAYDPNSFTLAAGGWTAVVGVNVQGYGANAVVLGNTNVNAYSTLEWRVVIGGQYVYGSGPVVVATGVLPQGWVTLYLYFRGSSLDDDPLIAQRSTLSVFQGRR